MPKEKKPFNVLVIGALVLLSALLASFIGVSFFKMKADEIVALSEAKFDKFSVIFEEGKQARMRAMGIGADTLLLSRRTIDPFVQRDRKTLAEVIDPFFQFAKKKHGIEQINFWIPPGKLFYRAEAPELGQFDVTQYRKTIKSAMDNQERIMAVETGQGGVVALRGIVPIFQDEKFYGAIEFVSSFDLTLQNAAFQANMKWGLSLSQDVWKRAERPIDEKKDIAKGTDTYFQYSDEVAEAIIRNANFDPRDKNYTIQNSGDKKVFIKTLKVLNFSGVPTITIAVIDDISERFWAATQGALFRAVLAFLLLSLILAGGYLKFDDIRHGLLGAVGEERRLIKQQLERGAFAIDKVKDFEIIKRRFFSNLVTSMSEPLLAIRGQLRSVVSQAQANDQAVAFLPSLKFASLETERLQQLISDYERVELFRQNLVRPLSDLVSMAALFDSLRREIDSHLRFQNFAIELKPPSIEFHIRGDEDMLRRALMALVSYAASSAAGGAVTITCEPDEKSWLCVAFTGSAYAGSNAPTESLLDSSRQFLLQLANYDKAVSFNSEKILKLGLSKIIVEFAGGTLAVHSKEPGFIVRLPAAV